MDSRFFPVSSDLVVLAISWTDTWFPLVFVGILLLLSALISSSEVALFSLTPTQKAELRESRDPVNRDIINLLEEPDRESAPRRLLATILIANNSVNIAIVLLSTIIVMDMVPVHRYPEWVVFLVQVVIVTFIIVLFGELVPKIYATRNNLKVARFMARPLVIIRWFFSPLAWFLIRTSSFFETRLRRNSNPNISVDELGHALELTVDDERSDEEHKILEGIVTFGAKEVTQVMTPRTEIAALTAQESFPAVLDFIRDKGFSRIPVYQQTLDDITGFLFIKDLLPHLDEETFDWKPLVRKPYFVSENKKIDDLLQEFQRDKIHLAIVVDEYGGTSGLITLEDILEEVVGEISDEFDEEELRYSKLDEHTFIFEGKTGLSDMYRILDIDDTPFEEARGDNNTLAGFLIELAGRIPVKGDTISFHDFTFLVEAADYRKIKRVKVTLPETPPAPHE